MVVASLQFGAGLRDEDPKGEVNIEDVVNVLGALESRHVSEASALIGAWHPIVEEIDRIAVQSKPQLRTFSSYAQMTPPPVAPIQEIPGRGKVYESASRFLIDRLKSIAWLDESNASKLNYLHPLLASSERSILTIATLNYDNTVELAAKQVGVSLDNGIKDWREHGSIGFGAYDAIAYRKLHGSINWRLSNESATPDAPLSRQVLQEVSDEQIRDPEHDPALIFGGRNKLTVRGPFLELLRDFRTRLGVAKQLIVIGYSFGDTHINEYIAQWLNSTPDGTLKIIYGPNFARDATDFGRRLLEVGEPRVYNLGKYAQQGIAEAFPEHRT